MLRTITIAVSLAAVLSLATAAAVSAATTPNPPTGSVNLQPVNVSANGTGSSAGHCGAQAAGTTVQPTQVSTSGASSPSGCGAPSKSALNRSQSARAGNGSATSPSDALKGAGALAPGLSGVSDLVSGGSGPNFGYVLFILLLIALVLVLFGFAIGRR